MLNVDGTWPGHVPQDDARAEPLARLTRWVLGHRRLVVLIWVALAAAGGSTASLTTARLGRSFDLPTRPSFRTAARLAALYHGEGGGQDPTVPVVGAPPGRTLAGRAGRALMRRVELAASAGGRFRALGFGVPDPTSAITAGVRGALPTGFSERTTGIPQLQSSTGQRQSTGVLAEILL